MLIKKLINQKVETESGVILGRVSDCVWDCDLNRILQFRVKRSFFDTSPLLIAESQIVRVEENKIVVSDNYEQLGKKDIADALLL